MSSELVLVVDDSCQLADYLVKKILPSLGYEAAAAYDGASAFAFIQKKQPDLILLDFELPDLTGLDILRQLRQDEIRVPVIFVTAHGSEEVAAEAFRLGAQDYLVKPVDTDRLEAALARAMTENRLRRQTEQLTAQLKEQVSRLKVLSRVGQSVTSTLDLDEVLRRIVEAGVHLTQAEEGFLALLDGPGGQLYLRAAKNLDQEKIDTMRLPLDDSMIGSVIQTGRPVRTAQAVKDVPLKVSTGFLVYSLLHVPILSKGRPLGVLSVVNHRKKHSFLHKDEIILSSLADYAAVAIENANLYEQAQQEIKERKRVEVALRESEERYALAVRGANDGLWDWDLRRNRVYFSPRWKAMLGYSEGEISDAPSEWLQRIHSDDVERTKLDITAHLQGQTPHFENEHRIRHKDGSYRWVLSRGISVRESNLATSRIAGSLTDITDRKYAEEKLLRDALYDTLTGLPNRALLMGRLKQAIHRKKRQPKYQFAVLFLDLDCFKTINDSLGHMMGDQLLVNIGNVLKSGVRAIDTVSRLGGDEFVILLDDIQDSQAAVRVARWIHEKLALSFLIPEHEVVISTSIGIVLSSPNYERPEEVLRDADIAMYVAKDNGKARYQIFTPSMRERVMQQFALETQLHQAFEHGELMVFYQPILELESRRLTGLEAVVCWRHPERGLIPAIELVRLAQETGLIVMIDRWVMAKACQQMRAWQSAFPMDPPLNIHVNVSGQQLSQTDVVEQIECFLQETQLPPSSLKLEISESTISDLDKGGLGLLNRLAESGIQTYVDGFGNGLFSLADLVELPIQALKLAQGFTEKVTLNGNQRKVVQALMALNTDLGLVTYAEGVETLEQMQQLQRFGCRAIQGTIVSPPLEADKVHQLLSQIQNGVLPLIPCDIPNPA